MDDLTKLIINNIKVNSPEVVAKLEAENEEIRMKMSNWKEEIKKLNQCSQRQDSTTDQLIDLYSIATKLGFYDAADFIKDSVEGYKTK